MRRFFGKRALVALATALGLLAVGTVPATAHPAPASARPTSVHTNAPADWWV